MAEFAYHRSLAPLMAMFLVIASVELLVVHLLVSLWSRRVAWVLTAISVAGLVWVVRFMRSLKALPVIVGADSVTFRTGRLMRLDVPTAHIAGLRRVWTGSDMKRAGVLKMSLLAYPNVFVDLVTPQPFVLAGRSRSIDAIAHRLDDPSGFAAALSRSKRAAADA